MQLKLPEWSVEGAEIAWSRNAIFSIADDSKGNLLIGTDGMGALIYDGKEFTQLSTCNGLCGNTIGSILTERNGKTWFSSMFGGVSCYDGKRFQNFTQANGSVGDNECGALMSDQVGHIWFSSEGFGVYRYDGQQLTNFGETNGLGIKAVQTIMEDADGRIWVGGGGGLYRFDGMTFMEVKKGGPWN